MLVKWKSLLLLFYKHCCFYVDALCSATHSAFPCFSPFCLRFAAIHTLSVFPLFFFVFFFYSNEAAFRPFRKSIHKKKSSAVPPRHILIPLSFFFFLHDFSFRRRTLLARRRKQQQQFVSVLLLLLLSVVISVQLAAYSLFSKLHLLFLSFFFFFCNPRSLSHVVLRNAFIACLLDFSLFFHCYYYFSHISLLFS